MSVRKYNLAIVGATGMVGRMFLKVLEERDLPIENLYLFSSIRSAGTKVVFKGKELIVEELKEESFDREIDIALFSAGGDISKRYAPIASSKGVIVIDNSSAWRMDSKVPLIVPEVNPEEIVKNTGIIANPNCSTIQSVVPLKVIDNLYGIKRVIYSTYQAVSGSGVKGVRDLEEGLKGNRPTNYPHPIVNNCLPHIDSFLDNNYTKEEEKMINETRKILGKPNLAVTATCVRVPVMNAHSISINVELEKSPDLDELREILSKTKGIILEDNVKENRYPMAINADGKDEVFVGRLRKDFSVENGLNLWVVADNIRKGAATNTVQIAELLMQ
ncbi:MAG: aspartate-semialdehyde dehydrogenase [Cetobacterium sp.]|uniref:aspartate-semialdehyde dehydrogenase n=1 Tax=Cetobacterium sp. TaxID=2071632 RepID=UPI002FCB9FEC